MNRLFKQSVAAAATLMLASTAHASFVTYEFTGNLTIGPMGDLAVPEAFSGHISFHDRLADLDASDTHGQYVDRHRTAVFEARIGDQDFIVHGGRSGEIDVDFFDNDPSVGVGGGADGLGIFATNQFLSMGFFQLYDPDVFHNDRIPSTTPPLSGSGGFFIDEGAGGISRLFRQLHVHDVRAGNERSGAQHADTIGDWTAEMLGYVAYRRRKASKPLRKAAALLPA